MTKPLYFYNGTTFEQIGPTTPQSPIAYQTSAPTGPATGDVWIDSDGDVDTYNRQLTRYYFIATAAQTTISGVDANSLTLAYVAGSEAVYVNGALQVRGQDYTATDGTSVVMSSALAVNDVVEIFAYTAFTVANAYTKAESDSLVGAAPGLKLLVPTSVAVGSGSGSVGSTGTVTFTGASSVNLNGVFSATYNRYYVAFDGIGSTTQQELGFRFLDNTTPYTTGNHKIQQLYAASTSISAFRSTTATSWPIGAVISTDRQFSQLTVINPFETLKPSGVSQYLESIAGNIILISYGLSADTTTSFSGFQIFPASGTITGKISVYGYKV